MNYKNAYKTQMAADVTQHRLTINSAQYEGWIGPVQFKFASAASGVVSLQMIRDGVTFTFAALTTSAKTDAIWQGSIFVRDGDILVIHNDTGVVTDILITVTYEPYGDATWDEFVGEAVEESSSSSSEEYSSSSSSSSSEGNSSSSSESEGNESSSSSSSSSE